MKIKQTLRSKEDGSINYVFDNGLEARLVQREPKKILCYLSSHTGCNQACRFCHLTQSKQTQYDHTTLDQYLEQAYTVVSRHVGVHDIDCPIEHVNFNFMARGEPLDNSTVLEDTHELLRRLEELSALYRVEPKFNISSIFPVSMQDRELVDVFGYNQNVRIFYSLYSLDPKFRRRWIPKAIDPELVLDKLARYQQTANPNTITLHWAFIKGENDSMATLEPIVTAVKARKLNVKFNLVRYNPYSDQQGSESSQMVLDRNFEYMAREFPHERTRIVDRVGFDVKASCGMFV